MLARCQVLRQHAAAATHPAQSSAVTAHGREYTFRLVVGATRDRDGGKHWHSVRSHEARMRAAAIVLAQLSDVGLVAVSKRESRWRRHERLRERRMVGARHSTLGMTE